MSYGYLSGRERNPPKKHGGEILPKNMED